MLALMQLCDISLSQISAINGCANDIEITNCNFQRST